jgi:magnesium-transporting ATPase (P-type)
MKLSEFLRCPIKVQRCAGRIEQKELIVQVDHKDVVPGDIVIFEPGDLFPGDVRLLSSKHLVVRYFNSIGNFTPFYRLETSIKMLPHIGFSAN